MPKQASTPVRQYLGLAFLGVCICAVAWWCATWTFETVAKPTAPTEAVVPDYYEVAGLVAPSSPLRVGEVWETSNFEVKLPIRNASGATVRITDVQAGCACVDVSPRKMILRPQETVELTLTIDLTRRSPWDRHSASRAIQIEIKPFIDGVRPKEFWPLEGTVRSRITLDVDSLGFGDRPVAGSVNPPRTIKARVHGSEGSLEATVNPPEAGSVAVTALEDGEHAVAVSPAATLPPGWFSFEVVFALKNENGKRISAGRSLLVTGTMQPEIRAFPAQLLLGSKQVGSTAEAVVRLQSPPGAGWVVDRVEIDSTDLKIVPDGADYRIRQQVTQEGDHSAVVSFFVRKGPDGKVIPITTNVSYFGLKAKEKP